MRSSGVGIYPTVHAPGAEAVAEPSAVFHVHPIQRREALASDRGRLAGDVHIVLHHEQRRVTQVLFQQEHVAAVEQKMGRIGMPQEMDVQPRDTGGLGQPSRKGADTVRSQRVPVYGQEEGIDAGMSGLGPEMVVVVERDRWQAPPKATMRSLEPLPSTLTYLSSMWTPTSSR